MLNNGVCAVVVTYHPSIEHIEHFNILRSQVGGLVVVDNGSSLKACSQMRELLISLGACFIENTVNLGIATALNTGVTWAMDQGFDFVLLLDQDSKITDRFVDTLVQDLMTQRMTKPVKLITPKYLDPKTGEPSFIPDYRDGPFIAITSGSLMPVALFSEIGLFCEELFIYCVDDDYSLRLRLAGFTIGESQTAILLHRAGTPTYLRLFGKQFVTNNYKPEIQYYWSRNRVWLIRRYGLAFPHLIFSSLRSLFGIPLKIVVAEKECSDKLRMFALGVFHGIIGRMGKRNSSIQARIIGS